jgi:hypothetical protein
MVMIRKMWAAAALAGALVGVSTAGAQTVDLTRTTIEQKAKSGDRLTITTRDGAQSKGRLVDVGSDKLVLQAADGQRSFAYNDIDRVRRYKNGIVLGVLIGAGAGLAVGLPLRSWGNNEGADGDRVLATFLAAGIGVGTGLDALAGSNRTIYRRPPDARSGFDLQPKKGGGAVRWTMTW